LIGNDIIDLSLAKTQSNWQRLGFLEKQFTSQEIDRIQKSEHPFLLVWRFWSMKEAVYKVVVQQEQKRFFAPKKFACKIHSETQGTVVFKHQTFQTHTQTTDKYIYTCIGNAAFQWIGKHTDSTKMWAAIERQIRCSATQLEIRKTALGIPNLFCGKQQITNSCTKTHHGEFLAIEYTNKSRASLRVKH
jgi:phosphopantetheinyl transferase (holo-ACP synthase)